MRFAVRALIVAAVMTAAAPAFAQVDSKPVEKAPAKKAAKLAPGDNAPALSIAKWIKGEPVMSFEKGKVYVVEFWATWCGPCIASMPHLSALQKEYKDKVTIIGVTSQDARNTLEKAQKMAADKGDKMGYTVAWDNERATNEAYMEAAQQQYIPCSFIVDKQGKVAYFGNNPGFLDVVLPQVLDGTWDVKKGNAQIDEITKTVEGMGNAKASDTLKKLDEISTKSPKLAPALAEAYNAVAWGIVDPQANAKNPDLDTAMKAAEQAVKLSKNEDGTILDTLARVYWVKGDKAKAIETQEKAIKLAPDMLKDQLQKTLDEYKSATK